MMQKKTAAKQNLKPEPHSQTVKKKHQKTIGRNWFRHHIRAVEYTSFTLSGLLGLTLSAMANTNLSAAVWTTFGAVVFAALGGACWWQKYLWDVNLHSQPDSSRLVATNSPPAPTVRGTYSNITPTELLDEVSNARPFQRKGISDRLAGIKVEWKLSYRTVQDRPGGGLRAYFNSRILGYSVPPVAFNVSPEDIPFLQAAKEKDLFIIRGTVESVDELWVDLKDTRISPVQ